MASEANKVMNCNGHQICWRLVSNVLCQLLLMSLLLTNSNLLVQLLLLLLFLLFIVVDDLQHVGAVYAVVIIVIIIIIIIVVVVVDGLQHIVAVIVARYYNIFPPNTFIVCRTFLLSLFLNLNYHFCNLHFFCFRFFFLLLAAHGLRHSFIKPAR